MPAIKVDQQTAGELEAALRESQDKFQALLEAAPVAVVIVDEIHVLNDTGRGPTLEILITILRQLLPKVQLIALSATIGNPEELAAWLGAGLVVDSWRPVKLHQGVYREGVITFKK